MAASSLICPSLLAFHTYYSYSRDPRSQNITALSLNLSKFSLNTSSTYSSPVVESFQSRTGWLFHYDSIHHHCLIPYFPDMTLGARWFDRLCFITERRSLKTRALCSAHAVDEAEASLSAFHSGLGRSTSDQSATVLLLLRRTRRVSLWLRYKTCHLWFNNDVGNGNITGKHNYCIKKQSGSTCKLQERITKIIRM